MNYENFEEYFSSNLKINDENTFQEKLNSLLSDKNKTDIAKIEKEKKEKLLKKRLQDESNEKKIDFILSDEISFEQFKNKNNDIKTIKEETESDNYNLTNIRNDNDKENSNSNFSITDKLINYEKEKEDKELIKLGNDIKNNNPLLYNWKKIKKYKEINELQVGLEKEEDIKKEINIKNKKQKNNQNNNFTKNKIPHSNKKNIGMAKKNNIILKEDKIKINSKKENNKDNDDDDLIMSTIQLPVQACQKTIRKKKQNDIINKLIDANNQYNNIIKTNSQNENNKQKEKENEKESLLNIFKREKEIKNKLQKILSENPSVSQNDNFSNVLNNDKFYNFNSNLNYLSMAKKILENKLTPGEKKHIQELEQEIEQINEQISDIINEKNYYINLIAEKKKEIENFEEKKNKIEFEYERDLINDLRSIINKFKIELYKKELNLNKKNNNEDISDNEELEILKKEYKKKKKRLDLINKNSEKNIIEIQKQIMIKKYENEKMKEKIQLYEQDYQINNLEKEISNNENIALPNINNKKEKNLKLNEEEEDNDIIINNNYIINNIIKTTSQSNHLNELEFEFPDKYFDEKNEDNKIIKHQFELDEKIVKIYNSGKKEIIFPNNTKKEIFPDGYTLVTYSNGDIKETIPNHKEIYYYKKDEVNQIVFDDGCKYIKYLKTGKIICNGKPIN